MAGDDKRKIRVSFRKNRSGRPRRNDWTNAREEEAADARNSERLSGKGDLTRRRTVVTSSDAPEGMRNVDLAECAPGRVLWTVGANHSAVMLDDGSIRHCSVRRVLRTLQRETRNLVVAGDRVLVRPSRDKDHEGVIERIEPRTSVISRMSGRFEQILTANVDQAVIVVSADDPPLKLGVVDRFLVERRKGASAASSASTRPISSTPSCCSRSPGNMPALDTMSSSSARGSDWESMSCGAS